MLTEKASEETQKKCEARNMEAADTLEFLTHFEPTTAL